MNNVLAGILISLFAISIVLGIFYMCWYILRKAASPEDVQPVAPPQARITSAVDLLKLNNKHFNAEFDASQEL